MGLRRFNLLARPPLLRLWCIVLLGAWITSYFLRVGVDCHQDGSSRGGNIMSVDGRIAFCWLYHDGTDGDRYHLSSWTARRPVNYSNSQPGEIETPGVVFSFLGVSCLSLHVPSQTVRNPDGTTSSFSTGGIFGFAVPYWLLLLASLTTPMVRTVRGIRRRARGLCRACGYDLRATRERCPECGAASATNKCARPKGHDQKGSFLNLPLLNFPSASSSALPRLGG